MSVKVVGVGVGQGGGNIIQSAANLGLVSSAVAINSTESDLSLLNLDDSRKVLCNDGNTRRGSGKVPQRGRELIMSSISRIISTCRISHGPNIDLAVVSASLGGGTGTGGVFPVGYHLKQELDIPVIGLLTLPEKSFTDKRTAVNTLVAAQELIDAEESSFDSVLIVDNEKLLNQMCVRSVVSSGKVFNSLIEGNDIFLRPLKRIISRVGMDAAYSLDVEDFLQLISLGGIMANFDFSLDADYSAASLVESLIRKIEPGSNYLPDAICDYLLSGEGPRGIGLIVSGQKDLLRYGILEEAFSKLQAAIKVQPDGLKMRGFIPDDELKGVYCSVILSGIPWLSEIFSYYQEISSRSSTVQKTVSLLDSLPVDKPQKIEKKNFDFSSFGQATRQDIKRVWKI